MEVLRIEHLSKQFGHIKAIDDISLSLSSGRIYALVGKPKGFFLCLSNYTDRKGGEQYGSESCN